MRMKKYNFFTFYNEKSNIIADVSKDVGQVFFAALVVESFIRNPINMNFILIGTVLSLLSWIVSVSIYKSSNSF
jgi:hypothetical protein